MATKKKNINISPLDPTIFNKRFKDAPWLNIGINTIITIGGAGGIGSNLCFLLGRMGYKLEIHDFDVVSFENIGVQFFKEENIGSSKTVSISRIISEFKLSYSGNNVLPLAHRIDERFIPKNICISCFDNMKARKILFESWEKRIQNMEEYERTNSPILFIDGRMTAETFQIYTVSKPSDIEKYRDSLFNDEDLPDLPCSFKSTPHNSMMIACYITSILNNYYFNYSIQDNIREVPFYLEVQQASLNFNTID